jgi:hypothetical protein
MSHTGRLRPLPGIVPWMTYKPTAHKNVPWLPFTRFDCLDDSSLLTMDR